jgi:hypothetical protein
MHSAAVTAWRTTGDALSSPYPEGGYVVGNPASAISSHWSAKFVSLSSSPRLAVPESLATPTLFAILVKEFEQIKAGCSLARIGFRADHYNHWAKGVRFPQIEGKVTCVSHATIFILQNAP